MERIYIVIDFRVVCRGSSPGVLSVEEFASTYTQHAGGPHIIVYSVRLRFRATGEMEYYTALRITLYY